MRTGWFAVSMLCAWFVVGCSSSGGASDGAAGAAGQGGAQAGGAGGGAGDGTGGAAGDGADGAAGAGGATSDSGDVGPYPGPPYGNNQGDTFGPMAWVGYANDTGDAVSTTKPFGPYSMDDARHSGRRYALVNIAEYYCPGCNKSAQVLQSDGKSVQDAGGLVIEVLATKGFVALPAQSDLDAWVNNYQLGVTTVMDPPGSSGTPSITDLGPRDTAYIVDLHTMKIVQKITGSFTGTTPGSIEQGIPAMKALLAAP